MIRCIPDRPVSHKLTYANVSLCIITHACVRFCRTRLQFASMSLAAVFHCLFDFAAAGGLLAPFKQTLDARHMILRIRSGNEGETQLQHAVKNTGRSR